MLAMMAKVGVSVGKIKQYFLGYNHLFINRIGSFHVPENQMLALLAANLKFSKWIRDLKQKKVLFLPFLRKIRIPSQHCQQKTKPVLAHWISNGYALLTSAYNPANKSLQCQQRRSYVGFFCKA